MLRSWRTKPSRGTPTSSAARCRIFDPPRIGDFGFISDGEVSALISPAGSVEWMCVPRFDSPSVFGSILGRQAGISGRAGRRRCAGRRRYLPGTMILETSWGTPTGWIIVRDCLLIGPWHHEEDRSKTYRRTPNDYEAEHILLRTIRCLRRSADDCRLRAGAQLRQVGRPLGVHERELLPGCATAEGQDVRLTLTSDLRIGFEGGQASARTLLKEGDVRFVALSWGVGYRRVTSPMPTDGRWTAHHWQHWLARGQFPTTRGATICSAVR